MMTSYKKIYPLLFALSLTAGCVSLNEKPEGLLAPENFYKTSSDFETAVTGIYQPLFQGYNGFDFDYPFIAEAGAEDIHTIVKRWKGIEALNANVGSFDEITIPLWKISYASIANANLVIGNLPNAQSVSADKKAEFEGQAKFLRALSYFNLTRWFGEVPLITYENQTKTEDAVQSSVSDIYALIVKDLKDAETKLPVTFNEKGRATQGAAKALLAKVYLTMAGWPLNQNDKYTLARDKAKEVMDMNVYQLEPNFADLWLVKNKLTNKEFIFALQGVSNGGYIPASHFHLSTRPWDGGEGGWGDFETDKRFFAMFPEGPRKDASFHTQLRDGTSWEKSDYGQPYIAKYRDGGAPCGPNDVCSGSDGDFCAPLLRFADILMIYAEAANQAEGNPSAAALAAINKVRKRAGLADLPAGLSKDTFDKAVLDERNWELAFEHNRWFDLVRRNLLVSTMKGWYPDVNDNRKLLPKPSTELILIKGLTQNPGY